MESVRPGGPLALSPARIETLADGVFAIAMTLLVIDLAVPEVAPYILSGRLDRTVFRRRP